MSNEKQYIVKVEIELCKGYDDLEKQSVNITVPSINEATEIWKGITGILQQYSKVKAFVVAKTV